MIPIASIERTARKAGVKRISAKALKELQKQIDEIGLDLARDAAELARHAHRKTIKKQDIKIVSNKI